MLQGFEPVSNTVRRRLIVGVDGHEKCGKSSFGLSAPAPIAFFDTDIGSEGVVHKFANKPIYRTTLGIPDNLASTTREECAGLLATLKQKIQLALESPEVRSILLDTQTDVWDLFRMARLGKLSQVMPTQYTEVNNEMRAFIRSFYRYDKNVIMTHRLKKQYVGSDWSGNWERAGFGDSEYLVQVNLTAAYDPALGFSVTATGSGPPRPNPNLWGFQWSGENCNFAMVAATLMPETKVEDWQ